MRHVGRYVLAGLVFAGLTLMASAVQAHPSTCSNCHTPHKAVPAGDDGRWGVPLWSNKHLDDAPLPVFTLYSSPTFDVLDTQITQPDGPSKLCLGCHDGTYIGSHGPLSASRSFGPGGELSLDTSHPISFKYDTALTNDPNLKRPGSLFDPATTPSGLPSGGTIKTDMLDSHDKMQCTSCHDVHNTNDFDSNLRKPYEDDNGLALCGTCHNK